jgi:hypothetical protein
VASTWPRWPTSSARARRQLRRLPEQREGLGNQAGLSEGDTLSRFDLDIDVALSVNQRNVLDSLKAYIGEGEPNAEYAQLGYAISNYTRNALLVEK